MTNDVNDNLSNDRGGEQHLSLETISAYIDGRLSEGERDPASTHLLTCAICQEELNSLRAIKALVSDLPEMRPARSFQLGPEYAEQDATGWFARLVDLMPALRAATAAVAMLLVVIIAGDVLTNRNGEEGQLVSDAPTTVVTQSAAPTQTDVTQALMVEAEETQEPPSATDGAMPQGAAEPQEESENNTFQSQEDDAAERADEGGAQPAPEDSPVEALAASAPAASPEATPTVEPTPLPSPTATPAPSEAAGTSEGDISNWRIAEIALAVLLAWMIVTLIGLRRFRRGT